MRVSALALVAAALAIGVSCVGGDSSGGDECTATMRWMQKDAYAEYAGRTSNAWPPHTTMELRVNCGSGTSVSEQVNHGTAVSATDPSGTPILVRVKTESVDGTEAEMTALANAFDSCHCNGTQILSMDSLSDPLVQDVIGDIRGYVTANMQCTGATPAEIAAMLQGGDADAALVELDNCTWNTGHSWETAFETALASSGGNLDGYHVCNNDAMLQADLWDGFASGAGVTSCSLNAPVCSGPEFFYTP